MCPLGTVSENKKKPGWGAAGLENLICWEDGATFQAVPGFSVFCSLFVAVLGNREAHFLHQLLPTNKPPLPKWGGNLATRRGGRKHRSMFPAEARWNSWEKAINVPPKPLSQNLALTVG